MCGRPNRHEPPGHELAIPRPYEGTRPSHSHSTLPRVSSGLLQLSARGRAPEQTLHIVVTGVKGITIFYFDMAISDTEDRTYVPDKGLQRLRRERNVFRDGYCPSSSRPSGRSAASRGSSQHLFDTAGKQAPLQWGCWDREGAMLLGSTWSG